MAKRIIICCDGTWNTPDKTERGLPCATNVVRVAEAVPRHASDGTRQLLYYDIGVGTTGSWWRRTVDGATGRGLSQNIREAYEYLAHTYEPGDALYLFGFSRGAFTVRSLAGLVRKCGILRRDALHRLDHAIDFYRTRGDATEPKEKEATLFRRTYAVEDLTRVRFIGVWDTVGALGNPLLLKGFRSKHRFHDLQLSSSVDHACQALAIDERRRHFRPALWEQQESGRAVGQVLEQRWFAGAHSNVGGGYTERELSDIALHWMASRALRSGLELMASGLPAPPDGPAPALEPAKVRLRNSHTGLYRLIPAYHRPIAERPTQHESVDDSVRALWRARDEYRPPQLRRYFERHPALGPEVTTTA